MFTPLKYVSLPSPNNFVLDASNMTVIGFELSIILIAHGHQVRKDAIYTLPVDQQFPYADASDMSLVSLKVAEAQVAIGLPEAAVAEMDAWLASRE